MISLNEFQCFMIKNKFSKILLASVTSLFFAPLYSFGFWYIGLGIGLIALGNGGQNYAAWAIMIGLPFLLMIICTFIQFKILNFLLKVEKWKIILWMILPFLLIPLIGPIIAQNELNKSHKYVEEWSKKAHAPDEFAKTIKPKITIASYTFSKNGTDVNEIKLMGSIVAEKKRYGSNMGYTTWRNR